MDVKHGIKFTSLKEHQADAFSRFPGYQGRKSGVCFAQSKYERDVHGLVTYDSLRHAAYFPDGMNQFSLLNGHTQLHLVLSLAVSILSTIFFSTFTSPL